MILKKHASILFALVLFVTVGFCSVPAVSLAADFEITPTSIPDTNTCQTISFLNTSGTRAWASFYPDGSATGENGFQYPACSYSIFATTGSTLTGTYHYLYFDTAIDFPNWITHCASTMTGNYTACLADASYLGIDISVVVGGSPPPPVNGLGELLAAADQGMASTSGFSPMGVTDWASTNLIKPFTGSMLAIIFYLRFWIVAAVIIGVIILFSKRAFVFFRH